MKKYILILFLIFFTSVTFASDATDPMNLDFDNISETDLFSFLKGLDEPEVVSKNLSPEDSKLESKLKEQIVKESQEFFKKYKKYIFRYFPKVFLMRENFLALMTPEDISNYLEEIIKILRFEPWKYVESPFKLINTQLSDEEKKVWASVGYDTKYLETIADPKKLKKVSRDGAGFWEFIADQLSFYAEFIERVRVDSKDNSIYLEKRNSSYWDSGYYGGFGAYGAKPKQDKSADLKLKEYWKKNGILVSYEFYSFCFDYWAKLFLEEIKYKNLSGTYRYYDDLRVILDRISGSVREAEYQEYMKRYKELLDLLKQDKRGNDLPDKDNMTQDDKHWDEFMELLDDV